MKRLLLLIIIAFQISTVYSQSERQNKQSILDLYKAFNERNFNKFYSYFSDSLVVHFSNNASFVITPNDIKSSIDPQLKAFPKIQDTILLILSDGPWVSICVKHAGLNTDSLWSIPPSNKFIDYNVMEMYKFNKGKISEIFVVEDFLSMYQQMGLIPKKVSSLVK